MANGHINETVKTPNAKTADSAAKAQAPKAPAVETHESEAPAARRGRVATMPACLLYRLGGKVVAAIHCPLTENSYVETGKGEGSAKGALEDSGFRLGEVSTAVPEWLTDHLPNGAELIGFAAIKGFPLPGR